MKLTKLFPILTVVSLLLLPSCFGNSEETDYASWRTINTQAFNDSLTMIDENGVPVYSQIFPEWDRSFSILMRWHNDREPNNTITPLSTSTCIVKYTLTNIEGDTLDSSAGYTCVPNNMITGFMAALTNMNVKDSVTAIIPYSAGYGAYGSGAVYPYSTLVFGIRLDSIVRLM